ncbi:alpha/beta hydrolase [Lentzea sp. NBRC 105346]|uniref:alpha/beta fold hydrolase n=1 Tax=Lentzea sp. NBRC 105346 TaxID=3032205 RepID=UPI0024A47790|nr:alpha/beta hydrolase [Lentzea sp. NBRC 105346]GLZ29995.1 alpha/beta hydrolase [Lentzea sp. NBRC 105346]
MSGAELSTSGLSSVVRGSGPALLLVHGAGGSVVSNYGPVLAPLTKKFTVIAPDLPGSGASPRSTTPLDLDDLADRVVACAVDAGHETFALSGFSMGTAIAVRAAVRHPDRVTRLVLTAAFPTLDEPSRAKIDRWHDLFDRPRDELARYVLKLMVSPDYLDRLSTEQFEGFAELIAASVPPGAADHIELLLRVDVTADLRRISVPTLVIGPKYDQLLSPGLAREVADLVPDAKFADIPCGHATALEKAAVWAALITEFLT